MKSGVHVTQELSYASKVEHDRFPETFITVEEKPDLGIGTGLLGKGNHQEGTMAKRVEIPYYPWVDSRYEVVHTSIVEVNRNLLAALNTNRKLKLPPKIIIRP